VQGDVYTISKPVNSQPKPSSRIRNKPVAGAPLLHDGLSSRREESARREEAAAAARREEAAAASRREEAAARRSGQQQPKTDPAAETPQQGFNPFFSIFAPGKAAKQPAPKRGRTKLQPLNPVMAPEQPSMEGGEQQPQMDEQAQPQQPQRMSPGLFPQSTQPSNDRPMVAQAQPYRAVQPALPPAPSYADQQQAVALNNQAVEMLNSDPGAAIDKLNRALKLNPSYVKARLHLGNAYHNLANRQRSTDKIAAINNYRISLDILKESVGEGNPAWQATKQDYESMLQSVH
jgi:hypothetical protein